MSALINQSVLMSGVDYFDDSQAINPFMTQESPIDLTVAKAEHAAIQAALEAAGVAVDRTTPPDACQHGVYTANWALTRGKKAVLASLPNARKGEEPSACAALEARGFEVIRVPEGLKFSGQGDALPCGQYLFCGSHYRSDPEAQAFAAETLDLQRVQLQTVPAIDEHGQPRLNQASGWPDSFFYDIDLAISVLTPELIAWCPEAFTPESQQQLRALPIDKIEVSLDEATKGFACNLVSTGETVVMSAHAPQLQAAIEARGLKTITPEITELAKGGGYIRCTTLTLSN